MAQEDIRQEDSLVMGKPNAAGGGRRSRLECHEEKTARGGGGGSSWRKRGVHDILGSGSTVYFCILFNAGEQVLNAQVNHHT